MNKIFARVLSAILLLCMIPAAIITALANGPGVGKDETENQSLVWDNNQYIPESIEIDGKFNDTGWGVNEWHYADSSNGTWDTEHPSNKNIPVSYKYQMHYDHEYFYIAAVITMPEGVTTGTFTVYLSELRYLVKNDYNDRGITAAFKFHINGNTVTEEAVKGPDDEDANNGNYSGNGKAYFTDDTKIYKNVQNGVVTIEFRNPLDATVDRDFTIYGAHKDKGNYGGNNISYSASMGLPHVANDTGNPANNALGSSYDYLYYPIWSQGVSASLEPSAENWPTRYLESQAQGQTNRNGLYVPKTNAILSPSVTIDGNLDEALWSTIEMKKANEATGTYTTRPFDGNSLSYSLGLQANESRLYGAVIIDGEAGKAPDNAEDLGTQFDIWFRGTDNRQNMEMNKDDDVASVEYEFYKQEYIHGYQKKADGNLDYDKPIKSYNNELLYYINHQYSFQLYDGGKYDNTRERQELYYDENPNAAPDYYVTKNGSNWERHEKKIGEDADCTYNYEYKVIDGKTYLEFWIDLASVHCDDKEIEVFVSVRHMQHTKANNTRNNIQLYYPKLLVNETMYAETSEIWITHYNGVGNDAKYVWNDSRVLDGVGIIFDNYSDYSTTTQSMGVWNNEVLLKKITNTSYEIAKIRLSGKGTAGSLGNPTDGTYLWYVFGVGTRYNQEGNETVPPYHGETVNATRGPLDTRNAKAYQAQVKFSRWNVGDTIRFNDFLPSSVTTERKVITYLGRQDATKDNEVVVSHIGMTSTNHTTTQELALVSAQYVKFIFDNRDTAWTFVSQLTIYQNNTQITPASYTVHGVSPNYPDSGNELFDSTGFSDGTANKSHSDPGYVGFNGGNLTAADKALGFEKPGVIVNLGKIYHEINKFSVWHVSNVNGNNSGISAPEYVGIWYSEDNVNWKYATTMVPETKATPSGGLMANSMSDVLVKYAGNRAKAYYSPYTITRTYGTQSLTNNNRNPETNPNYDSDTDYTQNTSCLYWWRNRHIPTLSAYGKQMYWMYDIGENVVGALHVAPETITVDNQLGDSGWDQYNWTEVSGSINGTGATGPDFVYQMRSDGEYLYVASVVDSTNPTFGLWIKSNDGKIKYYEIADGSSTIPVVIPEATSELKAENLELSAFVGSFENNSVTYPAALKVMEWDGTSWSTLAYEDSAFYGYTKELVENTVSGNPPEWTAVPETKGFRFGVDCARLESIDGQLIRFDRNKNIETASGLYDAVIGTADQRMVEFKIALSEFDGLNGFEYFLQVKDGENSTIYPKVYNLSDGFVTNAAPTFPEEYSFKVVTDDIINGDKLWLRNDYAPMTSLGAKINEGNYGANNANAIRFGARFTENFIRRQPVAEGTVTDYWDVADAGIIFAPTSYLTQKGIKLELNGDQGIAKNTARDIINWKNDTADAKTNFADYESFVFYVTLSGLPTSYFDTEFQFCPYVDYYDANGSGFFYGQTLKRTFNGVKNNAYYPNESERMPVKPAN